jgi:hypothetical protein
MNEKEMALEIGNKILSLEHNIASMKTILENIILPDGSRLAWRTILKEDMTTLLSSPVSQEKFDELRRAIGAQSDQRFALERLHDHFLGRNIGKSE